MLLRCACSGIGGESDSRQEEQLFQSHAGYFTSFAGVAMGVLDMHTLSSMIRGMHGLN